MTAFLHLIKQHLLISVQKIIDESVVADNSLSNRAANLFGLGRDTDVSQKERTAMEELRDTISTFPAQTDDKNNYEQLHTTLNTTYLEILALNKSPTTAGVSLLNLNGLLLSAFSLLKDKQLVDTPLDNDPLNNFKYYITDYHLYNITKQYQASLVARAITNHELTTRKEILLQEKLDACIKQISALDTGKPAYLESKRQVILDQIALTAATNQQLAIEFRARDIGYLGQCLTDAKNAVLSEQSLDDYLKMKSIATLLPMEEEEAKKEADVAVPVRTASAYDMSVDTIGSSKKDSDAPDIVSATSTEDTVSASPTAAPSTVDDDSAVIPAASSPKASLDTPPAHSTSAPTPSTTKISATTYSELTESNVADIGIASSSTPIAAATESPKPAIAAPSPAATLAQVGIHPAPKSGKGSGGSNQPSMTGAGRKSNP